MKFVGVSAAIAAFALLPAAAHAQDAAPAASAPAAAEIAVGATVYGSDGNPIGTVEQVVSGGVVLNTGTNQIPLPADAFASGEQGPTLNITKADLDAQFQEQMAAQQAQLDAALVTGAEIKTADVQPLGTVKTVEGENVVVDREAGPLTLPKEYFAVDAEGAPMVRATMAQIEAALSGGEAAPAG